MKTVVALILLTSFCIATTGLVQAAGQAEKTGKRAVNYNPKYKCVMVCKGDKPLLETLEDGLAYALDIPLALLSPLTSPVVSPLLEKFDSSPDRTYYAKRVRK